MVYMIMIIIYIQIINLMKKKKRIVIVYLIKEREAWKININKCFNKFYYKF